MPTWRVFDRHVRELDAPNDGRSRARVSDCGVLAFAAFGAAAEGGEQGSGSTLVVAAGVLAVLLVGVVVVLLRTLRQKQAAAETATAAAPAASEAAASDEEAAPPSTPAAPKVTVVDAPSPEGEDDVTKLRAFSRSLLPNLAELDEDGDEEPAPTEESKPELRIEAAATEEEVTGQRELIVTATAGRTDVGKRRRRNEDAMLLDDDLGLYAVCDGMGGYAGGDLAAQMAVKEVQKALQSGPGEPKEVLPNCPPRGKELIAAVEKANAAVWSLASSKPELTGMGTTIVTARFNRKKQRVYVAHVGDSRLYRLRRGKLQQMTIDHTLGAKGVVGALASNVRRAVGTNANVKVDVLVDKPEPSDLYLLCTDGTYKMLSEQDLVRLVEEKKPKTWTKATLDDVAKAIVDAANAAGGKDNVTVLLIGVEAAQSASA